MLVGCRCYYGVDGILNVQNIDWFVIVIYYVVFILFGFCKFFCSFFKYDVVLDC